MARQYPIMICMIGGELGSFVSADPAIGAKVGGKPLYRVFYHPFANGCSGSTWLPKKPEMLPYFIPEDAIISITSGKTNKTGVPEQEVWVLWDDNHVSQRLERINKDLLKIIEEKDKMISDLSIKTATQRITVSDSQEETKKQLQILEDTNKTLKKEKTDPFDRLNDGRRPPWRIE